MTDSRRANESTARLPDHALPWHLWPVSVRSESSAWKARLFATTTASVSNGLTALTIAVTLHLESDPVRAELLEVRWRR